jgi:probable F420-dependent oxidoreductase
VTPRDVRRGSGEMKVGIVLMPRVRQAGEDGERSLGFAETRVLSRQIEDAGFDSMWVYDHLIYRHPGDPTEGDWEAWTLLAGHAASTSRVELGTLVTCVPFRNPGLLAKMAVTVDEISGGRVILGLGAGWHKPEFDAFGYPFDAKVDRFEEALQIIAPLLKDGTASFQGKYHSASDAVMVPRGPRPGGPPIMIASFGPRMLRLTARYADIWNTAWYGDSGGFITAYGAFREACAAEGRDHASITITAGVMVTYGEDGDPAESNDTLTGTPQEIAAGIRSFEDAGADHVILRLNVTHERSIDSVAQALANYRSGGAR